MWLREKSKKFEIEDGYNKRPHFSLRNLSRCLRYIKYAIRDYGLERSIFEGVNIGFGSILKASSKTLVEKEIDNQFGINHAKYLKLVRQFNKTIPNHQIYFGVILFHCNGILYPHLVQNQIRASPSKEDRRMRFRSDTYLRKLPHSTVECDIEHRPPYSARRTNFQRKDFDD